MADQRDRTALPLKEVRETILAQVRTEIAKADTGRSDEPWALRALVEIIDAQAAKLLHIDRVSTKPNGALTNEWYWHVQSEVQRIVRDDD